MAIPVRLLVASLATIALPVIAQANSNGVCSGAQCFQQTYQQAQVINIQNAKNIQNAPHLAWWQWSGEKKNNSANDTSRGQSFGWFSSVPKVGPANPSGTIVFSPQHLTWAAYDSSGNLVKSGRASGGSSYCSDVDRACHTPTGRFRVYAKGTADCISNTYPLGEGGAPMPYCMYFSGGYAIHGSYQVPNYNASHGCIRVHPQAAEWLHKNFVKVGTVVQVKPY